MPTARKYSSGPSFQVHVPVHPFGTDPSQTAKAWGQPLPIRQTFTFSWVNRGNGSGQISRMAGDITPATAAITCTLANVVPGQHVLRVGEYELRPAIDFLLGISDHTMAVNLAATIRALPGFTTAVPGANVVTIQTTTGHGNDTVIEVVEWSPASAFVLAATDMTGYMDHGAPAPTAPLIV